MLKIYSLLAILFLSQTLSAQISAITQDGRKVILHDDHTWKYADIETGADEYWIKRIDIDSSKTVHIHFRFSHKPFSLKDGALILNFNLFSPNTSYDYYDRFNNLNSGKLKWINNGSERLTFDYYDQYSDSSSGKIKCLSNGKEKITFNYYDFYEGINAGKLKRMSYGQEKLEFDYYDRFYNLNSGKIRRISGAGGKINFEYFDQYNDMNSGKLKRMEGSIPGISVDCNRRE